MTLHIFTIAVALATNPMALVVALLNNPMFVLLLLSFTWLLPEITEQR